MKLLYSILLCGTLAVAAWGQNQTAQNDGDPATKQVPAPGQPFRQLDFHTDLFTGRFGYSVPFELAPGRHGSTPQVELHYSGGENGWCGVGWDLDLGYIERENRYGVPAFWSNGKAPTSYDDTKGFTFSLNGRSSSLVKISNGEYRAEIEGDFLRFQFMASGNYWQVTDKSGNNYYFGKNSDGSSRMSNPKAGWSGSSGTYRWALDRVETVTGDYSTISYRTVTGRLYPQTLSYNGFLSPSISPLYTVQFNLADRPDPKLSFRSGFSVNQTKRLDSIVHTVNGQMVWSNKFTYTPSPSTGRSMLAAVTRYGTNQSDTLPPTTFAYSKQNFGFNSSFHWTNLFIPPTGDASFCNISGTKTDWGDMDGDGLPDRVISPATSPYTNWWVQLNTGTGVWSGSFLGATGIAGLF